MTIEELLHDLAQRGQLNHLSVVSTMRKGVAIYSAALRTATGADHVHADHEDPVAAVRAVLENPGVKAVRKKAETTDHDFG